MEVDMLVIFSFLPSGCVSSRGDSETGPPLSSLRPCWVKEGGGGGNRRAVVGPCPGRLKSRLSRCDWDLVRVLDVVDYLYSRAYFKAAVYQRGKTAPPPARPPPPHLPSWCPPGPLCLREIPKGAEHRLARGKMSSALCGWDQRLWTVAVTAHVEEQTECRVSARV